MARHYKARWTDDRRGSARTSRFIVEALPAAAQVLHDCVWTLVTFEDDFLFTSDHPVSMEREVRDGQNSIGLMTADMFSIPLSRRRGLLMQTRSFFEQTRKLPMNLRSIVVAGDREMADILNQQVASNARRYVYLHPADDVLEPVALPSPTAETRLRMSGGEQLISEEGFGHSRSSAVESGLGRSSDGISLRDLEWPIPGRVAPEGGARPVDS